MKNHYYIGIVDIKIALAADKPSRILLPTKISILNQSEYVYNDNIVYLELMVVAVATGGFCCSTVPIGAILFETFVNGKALALYAGTFAVPVGMVDPESGSQLKCGLERGVAPSAALARGETPGRKPSRRSGSASLSEKTKHMIYKQRSLIRRRWYWKRLKKVQLK